MKTVILHKGVVNEVLFLDYEEVHLGEIKGNLKQRLMKEIHWMKTTG
jgi:hypothetical protein